MPRSTDAATPSLSSLELGERAERLLALGDGLIDARTRADLADAVARLRDQRANVAVLGAFKRGKSSLLNALLARELLPTGVLPLTSVVTTIVGGATERALIEFADGGTEAPPIAELSAYVTEVGNPHNERAVRTVRIELPHPLLAGGLQLLDTPGVGSIHSHNTQRAHEVLGRVDAALCVLSVDQPLAASELELFSRVAAYAPRLLFAINKVDLVGDEDRDAAVRFVTDGLRAAGLVVDDRDVSAVSARVGTGVAPLRESLSSLRGAHRAQMLSASVRRAGSAAATALDRATSTELAALALPAAELAARAERLRERLTALGHARRDAEDVLRARTKEVIHAQVDEPLLAFERTRRTELDAALDAQASQLRGSSPRSLARALDEWIDGHVQRELTSVAARVEAAVADALAVLQSRHADAIARLLTELDATVAELLDTPLPAEPPALLIREPSRFTFKLHDPENALDILIGGARSMAPGALGRRLVLSAARERLHAMVDRHAGRLRSELSDRVRHAMDAYARELAETMNAAQDRVETAVARATSSRASAQAGAAARQRQLGEIARETRAIRDSLED